MIFLQGFIKFDQGISEKCVGQTFDGRKKEEEEYWFAMVAILNPKWPPKYKNPPIWMKLVFK
jgi:hypothetical protein